LPEHFLIVRNGFTALLLGDVGVGQVVMGLEISRAEFESLAVGLNRSFPVAALGELIALGEEFLGILRFGLAGEEPGGSQKDDCDRRASAAEFLYPFPSP
jgi:hypothetical protein